MNDPLGGAVTWVLEITRTLGYVGLAALVALETIIPPIPSEVVLPVAGFLAGRGEMSVPLAILAATVGSVVGAFTLYLFARWVGERRLRTFIVRYGKWLLVEAADLDRALDWFSRHGPKSVFLGRLAPGVRSYISIPAGLARMPVLIFLLATALGSGLWNATLVTAGWLLGDRWEAITPYLSGASQVIYIVLGALFLFFIAWRLRRRLQQFQAPSTE